MVSILFQERSKVETPKLKLNGGCDSTQVTVVPSVSCWQLVSHQCNVRWAAVEGGTGKMLTASVISHFCVSHLVKRKGCGRETNSLEGASS